jgi:FkbM family methyltransferase
MLSTEFLSNFISSDATVIDVGARDGDSLLPFLPLLKEGSQMIAFEPIKKEMDSLIKMLEANNIPEDRFSCNQFGINSATGEFDFLYDTKDRNGGLKEQLDHISKIAFEESGFQTQSVWDKQTKINTFCWKDLEKDLKNKMLKASFIKVDTEGSDIVVLRELLPVINKTRPFIFLELYPGTAKEAIELINEIRYYCINAYSEMIFVSPDMKTINRGYLPLHNIGAQYNSGQKDYFLAPFEMFKKNL